MSLLKALKPTEAIKEDTDRLGGSGPLESDAYKLKIKLAYLKKAESGALGVHIHFVTDKDQEIRQALYVTGGDKKGNKNYWEDKDGVKQFLPGYNIANAICLLTVGKELYDMDDTEEKLINLYNADSKAEVPTKVDMIMELIGQEVIAGIIKETVIKQVKVGDEYVDSDKGETREQNDIDKIFRATDHLTVAEIREKKDTPVFYDAWVKKNKGVTRDKTKGKAGKAGAPGGPAGAAAATGGTAKPKSSLFGN